MQRKETKKETEAVQERVFQDRKYLVDAAVVRTMKARRTLSNTDLTTEVIRILRFPLDIALMKQRVELLIEGEYMVRDEKDSHIFHYVA